MGKIRKYSMLLFNFLLLMQLYFHHIMEVDAALHRQENFETCDKLNYHNETYFQQENEENLQRPKRPARMVPAHYLTRKGKNGAENKNGLTRFYGPATSCAEISKLGYTLNGYYLVKGKNQTKNNQVEVLGCRFKHPDGSKEVKEERVGFIDVEITKKSTKLVKRRNKENNIDGLHKRPARLLPLRMILGNVSEPQFYGTATSCEELGKLGYTLNGIYLVDCKGKSQKGKLLEVIECRFKQAYGSKEVKEERIGFVNVKTNYQPTYLNDVKKTRRIIQRPARLLPLHLLYGKEKNETEGNNEVERFYGLPNGCNELMKLGYTLIGYYLIKGTSSSNRPEIAFCNFHQPFGAMGNFKEQRFILFKYLPLDHYTNKSYPLMNAESGKCIEAESNSPNYIIQTVCNPTTTRRWKLLNGKQLCDESAKCITAVVDKGKLVASLVLVPIAGTNSPNSQLQNVALGKSKIKVYFGSKTFCVTGFTGPSALRLSKELKLNLCNDNAKNQDLSFISFE